MSSFRTKTATRRERAAVFSFWAGVFGTLWWVAAGPAAASWVVGLPTVGAAAAVAMACGARLPRLRWLRLPGFLLFVVARSLVGGIDVAQRAIRPGLAITPSVFDHPLREDRGALLLATLVSLLPGTVSARLQDGRLVVHSLVPAEASRGEIVSLERRVARLLDVEHRGRRS